MKAKTTTMAEDCDSLFRWLLAGGTHQNFIRKRAGMEPEIREPSRTTATLRRLLKSGMSRKEAMREVARM